MLTINIDEIEDCGLKVLVGTTEDHKSFLHLSEEDFDRLTGLIAEAKSK